MIKFEFTVNKDGEKAFPEAQLPVYSSKTAVCCDLYAAEAVTIPPLSECYKPTKIHTGIKACFPDDVTMHIYARSSMPNRGMMLANSVGIFESDYYGNPSNDGEIIFMYLNFSNEPINIEVGERIGQAEFFDIRRADNIKVKDTVRQGGFGSTGR